MKNSVSRLAYLPVAFAFFLMLSDDFAALAHSIEGRLTDSGPFQIIARATPYGQDRIRYDVGISALPGDEDRESRIEELQLARLGQTEYLLALRNGEPTEVFELRGKAGLSANRLSLQQMTRTRSYLRRVGLLQSGRFLRYPKRREDRNRIVIEKHNDAVLFLVLEQSLGYGQEPHRTRFKVRHD